MTPHFRHEVSLLCYQQIRASQGEEEQFENIIRRDVTMTTLFLVTESDPVLVAAVVLFVLLLVKKWRRPQIRASQDTRLPPCLPSIPVIGSLPFMGVDMNQLHKCLMDKSAKYGNVFSFHLGPRYAVVLNGIESIREALLKRSAHFADREPFYVNRFVNVKNKGIASSPYDAAFRRHRHLCLSIFKQFGSGERLAESKIRYEVSELIQQFRLTDGKPFDPDELLHLAVVNVIANVLFGRRYPTRHPTLIELRRGIADIFANIVGEIELVPLLRFVPPFRERFRTLVLAYARLEEFFKREVDIVTWDYDNQPDTRTDSFVRRFIESTMTGVSGVSEVTGVTEVSEMPLASATYDHEDLFHTLRDLVMAGDDTTATTLRWILANLANNPDVKTRLREEVDEVVGPGRLPSLADESSMPYTQAVILETMRRHTLLPLSVFHATTCDTQVGECFVAARSMVIVNLYSAHMDPSKWNEPHVFKPERFLDEHGQIIGKDRVVAFSLGKRSCLGEVLARQEIFLLLSGIVQNFDICPPEGQTKIVCDEVTCVVTEPTAFQVRMIARDA